MMYRVTKMGGKVYAIKISGLSDDAENIEGFVEEGTVVLLTDDLDSLRDHDIDPEEIVMADDDKD